MVAETAKFLAILENNENPLRLHVVEFPVPSSRHAVNGVKTTPPEETAEPILLDTHTEKETKQSGASKDHQEKPHQNLHAQRRQALRGWYGNGRYRLNKIEERQYEGIINDGNG